VVDGSTIRASLFFLKQCECGHGLEQFVSVESYRVHIAT